MFEEPRVSPIQLLRCTAFEGSNISVFIKRDDLLHPFVSGNKWRKLKYVLADALQQQKNHLVSFGGNYSNHLVALASAGAQMGFKTTAFVRGEEVNNHMLYLCRLFGMSLHFVDREGYKDKEALYTKFAQNNSSTYFIDEGGRGALAAKGCEEVLADAYDFTHAICAVGTGTTLAGLANAAKQRGIIAEGICVLKGAAALRNDIATLTSNDFVLHHQFHRGGYAKTDAALWAFIQLFAQQTGILLDQVYTAKMMMGLTELIQQGYYPKNSKILAIHTGGLLGLLSQTGVNLTY
jgi:1-aminocyclopropane-1-carboxylate deaminase